MSRLSKVLQHSILISAFTVTIFDAHATISTCQSALSGYSVSWENTTIERIVKINPGPWEKEPATDDANTWHSVAQEVSMGSVGSAEVKVRVLKNDVYVYMKPVNTNKTIRNSLRNGFPLTTNTEDILNEKISQRVQRAVDFTAEVNRAPFKNKKDIQMLPDPNVEEGYYIKLSSRTQEDLDFLLDFISVLSGAKSLGTKEFQGWQIDVRQHWSQSLEYSPRFRNSSLNEGFKLLYVRSIEDILPKDLNTGIREYLINNQDQVRISNAYNTPEVLRVGFTSSGFGKSNFEIYKDKVVIQRFSPFDNLFYQTAVDPSIRASLLRLGVKFGPLKMTDGSPLGKIIIPVDQFTKFMEVMGQL